MFYQIERRELITLYLQFAQHFKIHLKLWKYRFVYRN